MTEPTAPAYSIESWVEDFKRHYLEDFIPEGGATVKVILCPGVSDAQKLRQKLFAQVDSLSKHYFPVYIDSASTPVNGVDKIFRQVCKQLPWTEILEQFIAQLAHRGGVAEFYSLYSAGRLDPEKSQYLYRTLNDRIYADVFSNTALSREFRAAFQTLLHHQLGSNRFSSIEDHPVYTWMTADKVYVADVKPYQIYSKVTRHNARYLLLSVLRVLRMAGFFGVLLFIDAHAVVQPYSRREGCRNYTKLQAMETYQMLREFIDSLHQTDGLALLVCFPYDAFDTTVYRSRAIANYQALMDRLVEKDLQLTLPNPFSPLVRLQ